MHWINVFCLTIMLMSGLTIFNAHPSLYWGNDSTPSPWLSIGAQTRDGETKGVTQLGGHVFGTDGVLGVSKVADARTSRAFPAWATIPGPQWLTMGRHWHLFFGWLFVINGFCYILYTVFSKHLVRDLVPTRAELGSIGTSIKNHILFRHPTGDEAKRYNVLQSLAYLIVIFGLLPLVVLCGLALSPRVDTVFTGWVELLGGRQSARSLHFLAALGLVIFVVIHVFEVIVAGVWNEMRSMITGYYVVPAEHAEKKS